jgi:dipeptidyl aminopeptidase/acylaminoacyl peptidase
LTTTGTKEGAVHEVEHPERIAVSRAGGAAAFVVGRRGDGGTQATGIWWGRLDERPRRIDESVPATNLVFSPDGTRLAFGLQDDASSRVRVGLADSGDRSSGTEVDLPGYVEALEWSDDALIALAAEPGADSASLTSGRPLPGAGQDPMVVSTGIGWRRLWRVDPDGGEAAPLSPASMTVWEFAVVPGDGIVAVCSDDPREDGWYRPYLAHLSTDPTQPPRILHRSDWQLSSPVVDRAGERVAFVEGWASDRGLLAGEVRVLALRDAHAVPRSLEIPIDVTWLSFDAGGRLWFAGWDHLGTAWGWSEGSQTPVVHREAAGCVNSRWHPEVVPVDDEQVLTVRSSPDAPPEVVRLRAGADPAPWSSLNPDAGERDIEVREVRWSAEDGLKIEGLLVLPRGTANGGPPPLVVDIHGGPSIAFHHAWTMPWAEVLTAAGFAVLMPNPRGGVGRGQGFGRLNLADPAGAEMSDIVAGVRHCAAAGLVDEGPAGAIGASYGGYLTAWAVSRPDVFACGVVIAGVTNLLSCRGTANNNAFYDFLLQGSPRDAGPAYLERSPVVAVDRRTSPTLILHGEQDQCVPVGQAHELHYALRAAGVQTEMVVYPREGHQTVEPDHLTDQRRRVVEWFESHLVSR